MLGAADAAPAAASNNMDASQTMIETKTVLEARGIGKTVKSGDRDLVILRDIDLAVTQGEAVAVVGASGSGKSTLLAILAGLDQPSTGTVHLDGAELGALDEDARAELRGRAVGFVFQSFQLLPALTALENVMLPLEIAGVPGAEGAARAVLERVGLGERLQHYPKHLSGGEQQRVALARAFVVRPKLLLADEPTGNLDPDTSDRVFNRLIELVRDTGLSAVIATHNIELAKRMDRIIRLEHGRLVPA
jgi:putative ABC transport system ATP-binding protein